MELPAYLLSEVREGNAVLMLGAGASMEATDVHGNRPPNSAKLAQMLSTRFLGGNFSDYPLNQVSEFAINEADLTTVQGYIRDVLHPFLPSEAHKIMTSFRWRGIATTNYDLLVETAYEGNPHAAQRVVPFIQNGDRVDDLLRTADSLAYLKLHGCVTRTGDPRCPLILTTDQYLQYRHARSRLFDRFKEWACERSVVFIGNRVQDTDLRVILLELDRDLPSRPRYYIVCPNVTDTESRYWEQKRMACIASTAGEFFAALNQQTPSIFRGLRKTTPVGPLAISERFVKAGVDITEGCRSFLTNDIEYVKELTPTAVISAEKFYRGFDGGWSAIAQNFDARRSTSTDTILLEHFLVDENSLDSLEFILVKAHAGAGKSVFLRRLAWESSRDHNCLCLFLRDGGFLDSTAIRELADLCEERIFLFVEDATLRARDLEVFLNSISSAGVRLTLLAAARTNEWNSVSSTLSRYVTEEFELRYLSESEIDELLTLLERNKCLFKLGDLSKDERKSALVERAGRQLLVALHEATYGHPFEEIICDEYERISPDLAKQIYCSICVLYRFGAPVRAGIISRLYGINFDEFRERFFRPLEQVVTARMDKASQDFCYVARHPHIAEIVFEVILRNSEERLDEYLKCLKYLDVDYSADRRAFAQMTKGRELLTLFPESSMVQQIFAAAMERSTDDPHLFHQMAVYEMHRQGGDLALADQHLDAAEKLARGKTVELVHHTRAEVAFRRAKEADNLLLQKKYLNQAVQICRSLKKHMVETHAYHTIAKIGIFRLETALEAEATTDIELERILRETEEEISDGLRMRPSDDYLLSAEARLATLLSETKRAEKALVQAFSRNPRNAYVATILARLYEQRNEIDHACEVLRKAIDANGNVKSLHYSFARLRMKQATANNEELLYHFRRAYSRGDDNLDAQLLHARQVFIVEGLEASKPLFKDLSQANVTSGYKRRLLYPLEGEFYGRVRRLEVTYGFIEREGPGDWIYCHATNVEEPVWRSLVIMERVRFRIASGVLQIAAPALHPG